jgi:hypothetical protein
MTFPGARIAIVGHMFGRQRSRRCHRRRRWGRGDFREACGLARQHAHRARLGGGRTRHLPEGVATRSGDAAGGELREWSRGGTAGCPTSTSTTFASRRWRTRAADGSVGVPPASGRESAIRRTTNQPSRSACYGGQDAHQCTRIGSVARLSKVESRISGERGSKPGSKPISVNLRHGMPRRVAFKPRGANNERASAIPQRGCVSKPRVAAQRLPWVHPAIESILPQRGCVRAWAEVSRLPPGTIGRNPFGVGSNGMLHFVSL